MPSGYQKGESWKYFEELLSFLIDFNKTVYLLFEVKKKLSWEAPQLISGGVLKQSDLLSDIPKGLHLCAGHVE